MASGMDSAKAIDVIEATIGKTPITAWSGTVGKIKLMSTAASETADGTEISGGSYVAGGVTLGTINTTFGSGAYSGGIASITNSGAAVTQANMPTVGGSGVISASIYDNGPVRWWWGDLTTGVVTNLGDTLTFNTSSITMQLNV